MRHKAENKHKNPGRYSFAPLVASFEEVPLVVFCGDPFCFQHFWLVDGSERPDSIGSLPRTCHARLGTWVFGNFYLDQHHPSAFDAVRVSLTFPASHAYRAHSVLLGKIVGRQNGHQTGDAP